MAATTSSGGGASDPAAISHHGHALQFEDFCEAIRQRRRPAIDGLEGRKSVEIILGIYQAAETGRSVALPLRRDPALKSRRRKPSK
jgi:predicted dehydrogenase